MFLTSWLQALKASLRRRTQFDRRAVHRRPRLHVEALEDRTVPTLNLSASYPLGTWPQAVVTADVNHDGKLDLLTADPSANAVSVMLGKGNGTFGAAHNYAVGAAPYSLAVGDLNNDGKPDIVTADAGDSSISVLLGNGKGGFGPALNYSVGTMPYSSVALADFNGDGKLDAAVFGNNQVGSTVGVLLGNGNGTFAAARIYAAAAGAVTILAADFNGDGKVDLLTAQQG